MASKKSTNEDPKKIQVRLRDRFDTLNQRIKDEISSLQKKAKKNETYTKVLTAWRNLGKQAQQAHSQVFKTIGLATTEDLDKINKKINSISRKVNGLTKAAA